ncbi:MAG: signal peptidase I [Clostridia bacterium]|nr:signal peptidase I [Clostridia bacterium]
MEQVTLTRRQINKAYKKSEKMHEKHKAYKRASNIEFLIYILIVLMIAFAIRLLIFEPVKVSGDSMTNTLLDAERMFVEKVSYCFTAPKRGDIVICYYPDEEDPSIPDDNTCVKRVIGLPGDEIEIYGGTTYINGEALDESQWIKEPMWEDRVYPKTIVPEGHVFVMGDNRNYSKDSRNPMVGTIPIYRIVGRARSVIWPLDRYKEL